MEIRICEDKEEWNGWFAAKKHAEFLQSWEWGEFQHSVGREPLRIQVIANGEVVGQIQGFVHILPFGLRYIYVPRVSTEEFQILETRYSKLGIENRISSVRGVFGYLKQKGFTFARVESLSPISSIEYPVSFVSNRQPQTTLLLDLTKSEDDLLKEMNTKTRYNIRLAEKKGVEIREGKNIDWFWKLNLETRERDEFKSHPKSYYEKMLALPICHQLTAFYHDEPVASNIYIAWGGMCTYLHGASTNKHREAMAPYLLQWRGIQFAKKFGNDTFDWWGIAEDTRHEKHNTRHETQMKSHESRIMNHELRYKRQETRNKKEGTGNREQGTKEEICFNGYCWDAVHPWSGVTRFKVGFSAQGGSASGGGGTIVKYPGSVDVALRPMLYHIYRITRKMRGG